MDNYILLVACFVIGMLLRLSGRLPDNAHAALNGFIIHVSLPALTLLYVHDLRIDTTLLIPVATGWLMFGVVFVCFKLVGRLWTLPAGTVGALTLTGSLANTSFIGLPMIETFYGPQGLGLGILIAVFAAASRHGAGLPPTGTSIRTEAWATLAHAVATPLKGSVLVLALAQRVVTTVILTRAPVALAAPAPETTPAAPVVTQ